MRKIFRELFQWLFPALAARSAARGRYAALSSLRYAAGGMVLRESCRTGAEYDAALKAYFAGESDVLPLPPPGEDDPQSIYPRHAWHERIDESPRPTLYCVPSNELLTAAEHARILGLRVDPAMFEHAWIVMCPKGCTDAELCPWRELVREFDQLERIAQYYGSFLRLPPDAERAAATCPPTRGANTDLVDMHGHPAGIYHLDPEISIREALNSIRMAKRFEHVAARINDPHRPNAQAHACGVDQPPGIDNAEHEARDSHPSAKRGHSHRVVLASFPRNFTLPATEAHA